MVDTALE